MENWELKETWFDAGGKRIYIEDENNTTIVKINFPTSSEEKNMKLIADLPNMVNALNRINEIIFANNIILGSEEYFEIRGLCCDVINKINRNE